MEEQQVEGGQKLRTQFSSTATNCITASTDPRDHEPRIARETHGLLRSLSFGPHPIGNGGNGKHGHRVAQQTQHTIT